MKVLGLSVKQQTEGNICVLDFGGYCCSQEFFTHIFMAVTSIRVKRKEGRSLGILMEDEFTLAHQSQGHVKTKHKKSLKGQSLKLFLVSNEANSNFCMQNSIFF